MARNGLLWHGGARHGSAGGVRRGPERYGGECPGMAR